MGFSLKKIAKAVAKPVAKAVDVTAKVALLPVTAPVDGLKAIGVKSSDMDNIVGKLQSEFSVPGDALRGNSIRQGIQDTKELVKMSGASAGIPMMPSEAFDLGDFGGTFDKMFNNLISPKQSSPSLFTGSSSYGMSGSSGGDGGSNLPFIIGAFVFIGIIIFLLRK